MEIIFYYTNLLSRHTLRALISEQSEENSSHTKKNDNTFNLSLFVYFTICLPDSRFSEKRLSSAMIFDKNAWDTERMDFIAN